MTPEEDALASWLSAALDDPLVCSEYKQVITNWFNSKTIEVQEPSQEKKDIEAAMWESLSNQK
jgi:hypothetical protein